MRTEKHLPNAPRWTRVILILTVLTFYMPVLMMFLKAFSITDPQGNSTWTLTWFFEVFADHELFEATLRSVFIAVVSAFVSTAIGGFAAIALAKADFWGKDLLKKLSMVSLALPEIVFALSLLAWFVTMQMELGNMTIIIAHVTFTLAYVITTVTGRLVQFDASIDDAARDLGASELYILFKITLPMLKPALFGAFALGFLLSFDDFLITFFVNGMGNDTLPVKLYSSIKYGITPKLNALSSMLFIISSTLLLFFFKGSSLLSKSNKESQ